MSHARLLRRVTPLLAVLAGGATASVACSKSSDDPGGAAGTSNASSGGSGNTSGGTAGSTATTGGSTATTGGSGNGGSNPTAGTGNGGTSSGGTANGGSGGTGNVVCDASAAPAVSKLGLQTVVQSNDFRVLVYAAQAPGSDDWYLVDALGKVRVFSGGTLQATPFLDLGSEVMGSDFGDSAPAGGSQDYDERGLLSIAFPPDYAASGKFYVALVPTSGSSIDHDLVLEYTRSSANPLVADPASRKVIFELEEGGVGYMQQGFSYAKYHNGSTLVFGPDGKLYFGFGDGGGDCNAARPGAPQDVSSPYGKILRLDPSQPAPYAAADNPFPDGDARVFHYGVRNPFRFSFDSATGDLYIGEVGQWSHDSIAFAPAGSKGLNFGWPSFEGTAQNPTQQCASNTPLRSGSTRSNPIFNLAHGSSGGVSNLIVAIVGGSVYRGSAIPELSGAYLFGEYYPNRPMRALYQCGTQTSEVSVIQKRCDPNTPNAACFAPTNGAPELSQVAAIVEGHDKELYIPANGNALLKIVPAP